MHLYALLSDIHGNFVALMAVERDARAAAAEAGADLSFFCLGDVVDYGPQPNECVAWVQRHAAATVVGNHDLAAISARPPIDIDPQLWPIVIWTRRALSDVSRAAISEWPTTLSPAPFTLFHSSLVEVNGYIDNSRAAQMNLMCLTTNYGLYGHTHLQCSYIQDMPHPKLGLPRPAEVDLHALGTVTLPIDQWHDLPQGGLRALLNPGSVGQPRHHALLTAAGIPPDNRASYMLLREVAPGHWQFCFRRVAYHVAQTIDLLRALPWHDEAPAPTDDHPFARQLAETRANMPALLPRTVELLIAHLQE